MPNLSDNLNKMIEQRGWLAHVLAERAGVSYATVRRAMNGADVAERTWHKLAAGLGVSYSALLGQVQIEATLLDEDSRLLLHNYSLMTPTRRNIIQHLARELATVPKEEATE